MILVHNETSVLRLRDESRAYLKVVIDNVPDESWHGGSPRPFIRFLPWTFCSRQRRTSAAIDPLQLADGGAEKFTELSMN